MPDTRTEPASGPLYFEDLHVGRRFTSGTHTVEEHQITAFAREFDPQPFHIDRETAKGTFFRGLAASGWHTAALTMRLQVDGGLPIAGGIIGLGGELAWPAPKAGRRAPRRKRSRGSRAVAFTRGPRSRHGAERDAQPTRRSRANYDGEAVRPAPFEVGSASIRMSIRPDSDGLGDVCDSNG